MVVWFLSFLLLMCVTLIDLHILNPPCDLGMNPAWSWCMAFLYVVGFSLLIFCWDFFRVYIYLSKILTCNFLFWYCLCFWYPGDVGFIECLWKCSFLFSLLEEFKKEQYYVLLCMFGRIPQLSYLVLEFCFRDFSLNFRFCFISSDCSVQIIYFFLIQFWWTVCF